MKHTEKNLRNMTTHEKHYHTPSSQPFNENLRLQPKFEKAKRRQPRSSAMSKLDKEQKHGKAT